MLLAKLLHTVSRAVAILTSSVTIPVVAIVAQPQIAIIAEVIEVTIIVHKIVILVTPMEIFQASVAESVLVFIHVALARDLVFAQVTEAIAILVYTGDGIPAHVASAVVVFVGTHIVQTSVTVATFVRIFASDHTHI